MLQMLAIQGQPKLDLRTRQSLGNRAKRVTAWVLIDAIEEGIASTPIANRQRRRLHAGVR